MPRQFKIVEIKRTVSRRGVTLTAVGQSARGTKFPFNHVLVPTKGLSRQEIKAAVAHGMEQLLAK